MAQNGKAIKARHIGGVKVVPKWNWTREYTLQVRRHDKALSKGPVKWNLYYDRSWQDARDRYLRERLLDWAHNGRQPI